MLLLIFTLAIALGGIVAIEFGQAERPRDAPIWHDDLERRLLRLGAGRQIRW